MAAKQLRFAGHPFQVLLADEDYLKWLTTLSNAFLADLQSRYPVFMAALSEALDKIAAPKSAPVNHESCGSQTSGKEGYREKGER